MVNAIGNVKDRLNQTKSLFLKKGSKLDSYVLSKQVKEIKLGTGIGKLISWRVA